MSDLPPVTLLQQEIQSITSSMRRNQRWASSSAQQFATSQPPLPSYLQASKKRRGQAGLVPGPRPRRSKGGDQVEEGDLMGGFVELRRVLGDCRGERLDI
jgi:brefeldin A-resistance guanine nucleotide exchange factor 1